MLGRLIRNLASSVFARTPDVPAVLARAGGLIADGRVDEARSLAQKVLDADPACIPALRLLAHCELRGRRWAEAGDALARARVFEPENPELMVELGAVRRALGDDAEAQRLAHRALTLAPGSVAAGRLLAEIFLPGEHYLKTIERIHAHLRPATYVEIGVFTGESLRLVRPETVAVGVDPEPRLSAPLPSNARVYSETSDDFFARNGLDEALGGRTVDLAFIDGMHHFEYALRDFINLERHCRPDSTILLHDVFPVDGSVAERERKTTFWTGDVWRVMVALRKYRPDLEVCTLSCPPSGLGMVRRLDPASGVLDERFAAIVADLMAMPFSGLEPRRAELLGVVSSEWPQVAARLDRREW